MWIALFFACSLGAYGYLNVFFSYLGSIGDGWVVRDV